ncbi:MAG: energy transducer TonB [Rhizobiaceae bacterium]
MNSRATRWATALLLSAAVHAGAAIWLGSGKETVQVAGSAQAEIAMLGNAFQDSLSAGAISETVRHVETEEVAVQPSRPETVTETADHPLQENAAIEPARALKSIEAPSAPATLSRPEVAPSDITEPVETAQDDIPIAALQPSAAEPWAQAPQAPAEPTVAEPVHQPDLPLMPDVAPRPVPRPKRIADAEKAFPPPKTRERQAEERVEKPKRRAGDNGAGNKSALRGSAASEKQARRASSGDTGRTREAGNAAVTNYPGMVFAKLLRSLRYPSEARRKRIRGEVRVRFTVSRSGGVSSVQVTRSSGSPVLDKAALDAVRRAAPLPSIPPGAGRSSWSFTVPLQFVR